MAVLKAVNMGLLDDLPVELVSDAEAYIQQKIFEELPELCQHMEAGDHLDDTQWLQILNMASNAVNGFKAHLGE